MAVKFRKAHRRLSSKTNGSSRLIWAARRLEMLLDARDLHIAYGDIRAVNGVNFYLEKGELVSIIGANGAGKTSILNGIMGIVPLKKGKIHFDNEEMTSLVTY